MADVNWAVVADWEFRPEPVSQQWTWSPTPLPARAGIASATAPPDPGGYMGFSRGGACDGYELHRANGAAWVVSACATDPAADANLVVYVDPWHGSTTGFSVEAARSQQPAGWMDFVVGGEAAPASLYPAVTRGTGSTTSGYGLWANDGAGGHEATWDPRGERGGRVGAGLYWARLAAAGQHRTARRIVLR